MGTNTRRVDDALRALRDAGWITPLGGYTGKGQSRRWALNGKHATPLSRGQSAIGAAKRMFKDLPEPVISDDRPRDKKCRPRDTGVSDRATLVSTYPSYGTHLENHLENPLTRKRQQLSSSSARKSPEPASPAAADPTLEQNGAASLATSQNKLAEHVGWEVVMIAETPTDPGHNEAVLECLAIARQEGIDWIEPSER